MFIEDVRTIDAYLRATWHPETGVVVVSHWSGEVCTASTPISIEACGELLRLLVTALEETVRSAQSAPPAPEAATSLADRLLDWARHQLGFRTRRTTVPTAIGAPRQDENRRRHSA